MLKIAAFLPGRALAVCLILAVYAEVSAPAAHAEEELTFAMQPQLTNVLTFSAWRPLLDRVEKETGVKFTLIFPKDFAEYFKLCREGKVDFTYSNPIFYAQISTGEKPDKNLHEVFAVAMTPKGTDDFYGLFISRADNPGIKTFADIKGKKGWIVGNTSAAGFIFQNAYAMDRKMDLLKDCALTESPGNKQEKVVMAVYNREADFGTIRNGILEIMTDRIDTSQIRILARTPRYPAWPLSARIGLKPETAKKVKEAFLRLPKELVSAAQLPGGVETFVLSKNADFDPVKKLLDKVKFKY